ncbi:hypothetical protein FG386_003433 [Cryptosporidium ryanae]|uniref:uncharacterized protein n=1 Tax=Cryptosporidium ryanae TaxID=515981 RepID=UPI00351A2B6C|nr:hypothetical protein FG386_003433 [Cryptosporidium ryanae]
MDSQIKLLYDLVHRCHYSSAVRQANGLICRLRNKTKNRDQCCEDVLVVMGLRALSHLKMGNYIKGEEDVNCIMESKFLNEDVIIILWHYYILSTNIFNIHVDKLRFVADYFQNGFVANILSEQFETDLLSLYCYLEDFSTGKSLCNKLYRKYEKKPHYLALNVFISFLILQRQTESGGGPETEASLLALMIEKFLKSKERSCLGPLEGSEKRNELFERRTIANINLIKLFLLRKTRKFDLYHTTCIELFSDSGSLDYYNTLIPGKCGLLRNLAVLEEHQQAISARQDKLQVHYDTLFKLTSHQTEPGSSELENIRLTKHLIVGLFKEVVDTVYNYKGAQTERGTGDILIHNDTQLRMQSSQSQYSQLTSSSSFQTQSTMSSICNNVPDDNTNVNSGINGNGVEIVCLDNILGVIDSLNDKYNIRDKKEVLYGMFFGSKKARIVMLELFSEVVVVLNNKFKNEEELSALSSENNPCNSPVKSLIDNLLYYVNGEIINMISAENENNVIIDLKILLFSYFKIDLRNNAYEDSVIYAIYNDLSCLLSKDVLRIRPVNWIYHTNRLQILTIYNQTKLTSSSESLKEHNFDLNEILQIFKNVTLEKETKEHSKLCYFLISLSIYCLSTPFGGEEGSYNQKSLFLFILIYVSNNLPAEKRGSNYFLYNIISELCPLLGLYSLSHFIRNEILNIKRSQNVTLYTYSNFTEMLAYPYFSTLNCGKTSSANKETRKDKINMNFKHDGTNINILLDSHLTIYSEVRETYIESLRENTYSILNLLECQRINKSYSDCNTILTVFGIANINRIFSLLLSKSGDYMSLISSYSDILREFICRNNDNILENCNDDTVKQDFSPALTYYMPIYNIELKLSEMENELVPSGVFRYSEYPDFKRCVYSNQDKEAKNELAEFTSCLPKLKYKLTQRLKIWFTALILFNDITAVTSSSSANSRHIQGKNQLLSAVESHKRVIFSGKYSDLLLDKFDFVLHDEVTVPILASFFEIVNANTQFSGGGDSQTTIRNNANSLIDLINGKLNEVVSAYILQEPNTSAERQSYVELERQFEKVTSVIFGPVLLILLIKDWLSSNLSKKLVHNFTKNITNSISNTIERIYNNYRTESFNGTVEIADLKKLLSDMDYNAQDGLASEFIIDYPTLLKSQKISAENIQKTLVFIINSINDT